MKDKIERIELLPCPFCGGDAYLHEEPTDYWYVACNNCINQTTHFFNGKDVVIERWNTRTESPELRKTKAALAADEEWEAAVFAKAYRRGYWEGCSATAFPSEVENAYERWVKNGKPTHLETDHAVKAQAKIKRLKGE